MRPLTPRQREIFNYIAAFIRAHAYAPSLAEIGDAMHLSSLATVHKHLTNLVEKGYVLRRWGLSRQIKLVVQSGTCPTCGACIAIESATTT